jgi:hypothetical protein
VLKYEEYSSLCAYGHELMQILVTRDTHNLCVIAFVRVNRVFVGEFMAYRAPDERDRAKAFVAYKATLRVASVFFVMHFAAHVACGEVPFIAILAERLFVCPFAFLDMNTSATIMAIVKVLSAFGANRALIDSLIMRDYRDPAPYTSNVSSHGLFSFLVSTISFFVSPFPLLLMRYHSASRVSSKKLTLS